jgi:hypothetical protein
LEQKNNDNFWVKKILVSWCKLVPVWLLSFHFWQNYLDSSMTNIAAIRPVNLHPCFEKLGWFVDLKNLGLSGFFVIQKENRQSCLFSFRLQIASSS